jgi:predicted transcriptional regulator
MELPSTLKADPRLAAADKDLASMLWAESWADGPDCFLAPEEIAKRTKKPIQMVERSLSRLSECGHICRDRFARSITRGPDPGDRPSDDEAFLIESCSWLMRIAFDYRLDLDSIRLAMFLMSESLPQGRAPEDMEKMLDFDQPRMERAVWVLVQAGILPKVAPEAMALRIIRRLKGGN